MSDENTAIATGTSGPVGPQGEAGQAPPAKPGAVTVTSLDQLEKLVAAPIWCEFYLDRQLIRIECRRVGQGVDEQVRALRREAMPPFDSKRGPNGDYDFQNVGFLARRDANEKKARALLIYTGCPAVAAKCPGLTTPDKIHEFVRGLLSENILDLIASTVSIGGVDLVNRANFTLPGALEN